MANLGKTRPRWYLLIGLLVLADIGMALYLLSPLRQGPQQLQRRLEAARRTLQQQRAQGAPLQGMDEKLAVARNDLTNFYRARFGSEESSVAIELGKLATQAGVHISGARYKLGDSPVTELRRVEVEAGVDGDYLGDVKFINALERDKMFFILDSVTLDQQQGGIVRLALKLETFKRST